MKHKKYKPLIKIVAFIVLSCIVFGSCMSCRIINLGKAFQNEKISYSEGKQKFEFIDNKILINTTIDGKINRDFIFDSGASSIILFTDDETTEHISNCEKLKSFGSHVGAEGVKNKNIMYILETLESNLLKIKNSIVLCINNKSFNFECDPMGIIGSSTFSDNNKILNINMADSTIAVLDSLPDLDNWVKLESKFNKVSNHIVIPVDINGVPTDFYFDTGNNGGAIITDKTYNALKKDKAVYNERNYYGYVAKTATGALIDTVYNAKCDINLNGNYKIDSVNVVSFEKMIVNSLGMEVFKHFNMLIDYKDKNLYIQQISKVQNTDTYDKILGFGVNSSIDEGAIIAHIYKDSKAEKAGLKPGDKIMKINNYKESDFPNCDTKNYVKTILKPAGNEIIVKRDNEEIKVTL